MYVSHSSKQPCLESNGIWGSELISNGKELGEYIFKQLMEQIQRV